VTPSLFLPVPVTPRKTLRKHWQMPVLLQHLHQQPNLL
jgi:hypothetical protein